MESPRPEKLARRDNANATAITVAQLDHPVLLDHPVRMEIQANQVYLVNVVSQGRHHQLSPHLKVDAECDLQAHLDLPVSMDHLDHPVNLEIQVTKEHPAILADLEVTATPEMTASQAETGIPVDLVSLDVLEAVESGDLQVNLDDLDRQETKVHLVMLAIQETMDDLEAMETPEPKAHPAALEHLATTEHLVNLEVQAPTLSTVLVHHELQLTLASPTLSIMDAERRTIPTISATTTISVVEYRESSTIGREQH